MSNLIGVSFDLIRDYAVKYIINKYSHDHKQHMIIGEQLFIDYIDWCFAKSTIALSFL